jgi:hypothetical protein
MPNRRIFAAPLGSHGKIAVICILGLWNQAKGVGWPDKI